MNHRVFRSVFGALVSAGVVAFALWLSAGPAAQAQVTGTSSTDLQNLLNQVTTATGQTGTTGTTETTTGTTGTTTDTGTGTGTSTGTTSGTSPTRGGLNNVGVGTLDNSAPGNMVQRGIGLHSGTVTLPGDADQFQKTNPWKQLMFDGTEAVLNAVQTGMSTLLQRLIFGLGLGAGGLFGPTPIQIGNPIDNAATMGGGTVMPL